MMKSLKILFVSSLCLILLGNKCSGIDPDLQPPVGWDCVVLNKNKSFEEVREFLEVNSDSPDHEFPLDDLYALVGGLNGLPTCFCVHGETKKEKELFCSGYLSQSPERYKNIQDWGEEKLKELAKYRRRGK